MRTAPSQKPPASWPDVSIPEDVRALADVEGWTLEANARDMMAMNAKLGLVAAITFTGEVGKWFSFDAVFQYCLNHREEEGMTPALAIERLSVEAPTYAWTIARVAKRDDFLFNERTSSPSDWTPTWSDVKQLMQLAPFLASPRGRHPQNVTEQGR